MDNRSSTRTSVRRPPLGDATRRVNNAIADRSCPAKSYGSGPNAQPVAKMVSQGQLGPPHAVSTSIQNENVPYRAPPTTTAVDPRAPTGSHDARSNAEVNRESPYSTASSSATAAFGRPRKTHIGPWQLGKTLGKGSSARVRAARHCVTHHPAAVKIVPKKMASITQAGSLAKLDVLDNNQPLNIDGVRRMPLAIEREVAILKLIEHHNIMKLYDIWENRSEM